MKTNELISRTHTAAARIARELVTAALKTYVPEDIDQAVENAIAKFTTNMREAARAELRFQRMTKIPPKTGI